MASDLTVADKSQEMEEESAAREDDIAIALSYKGQQHSYTFPPASRLSDLSERIASVLSLPETNQKFLISPKPGLLKPPFSPDSANGALELSTLATRKITLIGSTPAEVTTLDAAIATSQRHANRRPGEGGPVRAAMPARTRDWRALRDATTYTFMQCRPLPYLPNPQRSLRFLERLRDDAGIRSVMAAHKWSVGLLTEMDPAAHTTHESRTLGLNRNRGEVIELRLRTDAYDGYRDYRTIRRTLCHELTHNVFGDHDRDFWELCRRVEREVERADWRAGGRAVGDDEFYNPHDRGVDDPADGAVHDHGAWVGGAHVLGGGSTTPSSSSDSSDAASRREAMARAVEERAKRQQQQQ